MATASAILWLTWLRRIASCFFFTLTILFATLWVRSYQSPSNLSQANKALVNGKGYVGVVLFLAESTNRKLGWQSTKLRDKDVANIRKQVGIQRIALPFHSRRGWQVVIPHWFLVLITTLLAIVIRPAPRLKFSLRDLFTLTTVAALTIGPLAFWLRSIS